MKRPKFHYYPETDSLYIELSTKPGADTKEVAQGIVLDYDEAGRLVGIDIDSVGRAIGTSPATDKRRRPTHGRGSRG